jgi:hypothetical protein
MQFASRLYHTQASDSFARLKRVVVQFPLNQHRRHHVTRPGHQEGVMRETVKEPSHELALSQRRCAAKE